MQYVAYFCVFLSDIGNVFNFSKFDAISIQENKHQLNQTIHLMLLSNHRMAANVSWPRKPLFKNQINKQSFGISLTVFYIAIYCHVCVMSP